MLQNVVRIELHRGQPEKNQNDPDRVGKPVREDLILGEGRDRSPGQASMPLPVLQELT
jgi:hypothetical protein